VVDSGFVFPLLLEYLSFVNIKMGSSVSRPAPTFQLAGPAPTTSSRLIPIAGAFVFIGIVFMLVFYAGSAATAMGVTRADLAPTSVDGKTGATVASGVSGTSTNLQFWMYIKDWDYRFGETKAVIAQTSSTNPGVSAPAISLHPTDNSLDVTVSVYSNETDLQTQNRGSGTSYTVTLENVPLQSWFSVSTTIYNRNMDVYINGQLFKSVILPGVAMPAAGNIVIGGGGGFSGAVCTVSTGSVKLEPADAANFYSTGTACSASTPAAATSQLNNLNLFGYTFVFGVKDSAGKQVSGLSSSDVSGWFSSSK
jgi:hypothetical protein